MIITIDGPTATGKSTIAKKLAHEIGYIYFDTGAMYRCVTFAVLKNHIDPDNRTELQKILDQFHFEIKIKHGDRVYFVDGEDVSLKIRGNEITSHVSKISAIPAVREKLVALQREHAVGVNAVFEGRDMGTTVFPEAKIKIFLTGRPEVRASRRLEELKIKFPAEAKDLTLESVLAEMEARDRYDEQREYSPLKKAKGAYEIDTSDLTTDEVIFKILEYKDSVKTTS